MPYTTFFMVGSTWPENLISPMPSARPRPEEPSQPRKKPSICHSASRPRQPGMTGSPLKWQGKNQRSGLSSSTARTRPLPYSPPTSAMSEMRSNISIGGSGSCGPSTKSSPRAQASRSSYSKFERRSCIRPSPPLHAFARFPNIWEHGGKAAPLVRRCRDDTARQEVPRRASRFASCGRRRSAYNDFTCNDFAGPANGPLPGAAMPQSRPVISDASKFLAAIAQPQAPTARTDLNGCPWHDVKAKLREVGLRPTRQRMALGWILFAKGDRHVTAEMLYEEATRAKVPVSLATVYNTLHQFTEVGLLRQVAVDGSKAYFDTNNSEHHHFFVEGEDEVF